MVNHPLPSSLSLEELRARAERYREMAMSAGAATLHAGLHRLAERFETLAEALELVLPGD
jgi:hypothetical protein